MLRKRHNVSVCALLLAFVLKECNCYETVETKIKQGLLSGKVEKTFLEQKNYYSFKGIPYAEAPLGEFRFKPPKPHQGWDETYKAYKNQPTCVQHNTKMRNGEKYGISGSEDCLYISVFTPSLTGSAAVMVFDYHENFRTGYNGTEKYSSELLAEENVVVVTVSYRLSILGYLTTEDETIAANNGLRDYLLGLKWVQENIKYFGGDPDRVTLMGSRGGATVANLMLYTKQAAGLFHAITMQSGTAYEAIYFPEKPKEFAFKLAELVDIKSDDSETLLKALQEIDVIKLYEKENDVIDIKEYENNQKSMVPFSPTIEPENADAIITSLPEAARIVNDVPVLIGLNSREGLEHASYLLFEPRLLSSMDDFFVHFPIRSNFRFDLNNTAFKEFKEDIKDFYLEGGYLHHTNIMQYVVYVGDTLQNYAINYAAKRIAAELKSPTFYYMFDFHGFLNENLLFIATNTRGGIENWGASAGDELCYLHVCARIRKNYDNVKSLMTVQNEIKVIKKMVRLWTNFAKTRNPTPKKGDDILKNLIWQPIDKESDNLNYLHISKNLGMDVNPLGEREKFWDSTLKKYSAMAVDGVAQKKDTPREDL